MFWKLELREKYCEYDYVSPGVWGKTIELNDVLDAKPIGYNYNVKLQYSSIGLKNTGIAFSSAQIAGNFLNEEVSRYIIGIFHSS